MQPLKITAHLQAGYTARTPWTPAIDGIVAAAFMKERLGPDAYRTPAPSGLELVEGLPFDRIDRDGLWWYAASSPIVVGLEAREKRHYHRRFDDRYERFLPEGIKRVQTATGAFKSARLFDTRVVCRALRWHAIGDPAEVERLVGTIEQIGGKRGTGYGRVLRWEITPDGDPETARRYRPLPVALGIPGQGLTMPWGLVPPSRAAQVECWIPEARYEDR